MQCKSKISSLLLAILLIVLAECAHSKANSLNKNVKPTKMNTYILLIRLPLNYGAEQAAAVRPEWNALTDQWKSAGIYVTSYVFPSESYVVSGKGEVTKVNVVSNGLRIISSLLIQAPNFEEALSLAKKCPILKQGGTVEVREVQPR